MCLYPDYIDSCRQVGKASILTRNDTISTAQGSFILSIKFDCLIVFDEISNGYKVINNSSNAVEQVLFAVAGPLQKQQQ